MTADDPIDLQAKHRTFIKILAFINALFAWFTLLASVSATLINSDATLTSLSFKKLSLILVLFSLALILTWASIRLWRDSQVAIAFLHRIQKSSKSNWLFILLPLISFSILALSWVLIFLPEQRAIAILGPLSLYLPGLKPLLWLLGLMSLSLIFLASMARSAFNKNGDLQSPLFGRVSITIFAGIVILWALISITGLGAGFDISEWNAPGAPILFSQLFFALVLAMIIVLIIKKADQSQWIDAILFLLIWLIGISLWNSISPAPTYYSSAATIPAGQTFPLSDAFNHDVIANNVLIGEGFSFGNLQAIRKPLYAAFLATLHLITDSNYEEILQWQIGLLALFPAILFLLGRKLHSRFAGLLLAILILFRESNALLLGNVINVSHAKLLMTDFMAALGLALFLFICFQWFGKNRGEGRWALLSGGAMGLLFLLRSQQITVIFFMGFFLLLAFRAWGWRLKEIFQIGLLFGLGFALTMGPWMLRNRAATGEWILGQSTAAGYLAQRYSEDPEGVVTTFLPGESEGEYYARHTSSMREYVLAHPAETIQVVGDNYMRNLVLTLLPMPLTLQLWELEDHVREQTFWPSWSGEMSLESGLMLLLVLFVIANGIASAWRRANWLGLLPLVILLGYSLSLALARVSGWRYNQPVDWIAILYFVIGLSQMYKSLLYRIGLSLGESTLAIAPGEEAQNTRTLKIAWPKLLGLSVLILLIGSSLIIAERAIPVRYETFDQQFVAQTIAGLEEDDRIAFQDLLNGDGVRTIVGRALYPRFWLADQGSEGRDFALIAEKDFSRISLFIVGPHPSTIILPFEGNVGEWQSGLDSIALLCKGDSGLTAGLLILKEDDSSPLVFLSSKDDPCP